MKTTTDEKLKKYLLSYYMDMLKGTLFRQTQFAEFEYLAHDMAEKGQPLTKDVLCNTYLELNKKYYGRSVVSDPEIAAKLDAKRIADAQVVLEKDAGVMEKL